MCYQTESLCSSLEKDDVYSFLNYRFKKWMSYSHIYHTSCMGWKIKWFNACKTKLDPTEVPIFWDAATLLPIQANAVSKNFLEMLLTLLYLPNSRIKMLSAFILSFKTDLQISLSSMWCHLHVPVPKSSTFQALYVAPCSFTRDGDTRRRMIKSK